MITREQIMETLVETLEPLDHVYAMWEGGAVGYGRLDEWSDIDLYVDARDEHVKEVFSAVEKALESISRIDLRYEVPTTPAQGYEQMFYRLAGTSKFLLIDLAVLRHSAPYKYLESEIHGEARFYFNKGEVLKPFPLDAGKLLAALKLSLERIQKRFDLFECFVQKEMNRKDWIDALDTYRIVVLDSLVEALRIKHKPVHHDFKTRYLPYDLPAEIVGRLKELYFVKDEKDLAEKYSLASRWFLEVVKEIDLGEIEKRLKKT